MQQLLPVGITAGYCICPSFSRLQSLSVTMSSKVAWGNISSLLFICLGSRTAVINICKREPCVGWTQSGRAGVEQLALVLNRYKSESEQIPQFILELWTTRNGTGSCIQLIWLKILNNQSKSKLCVLKREPMTELWLWPCRCSSEHHLRGAPALISSQEWGLEPH